MELRINSILLGREQLGDVSYDHHRKIWNVEILKRETPIDELKRLIKKGDPNDMDEIRRKITEVRIGEEKRSIGEEPPE
jgi:hypothetical protein